MNTTIPERLGDFEIVREIARGGMGVVHEARQVSLNRRVALKVLSCGLSLTPKAVQRFRREAEAAAKLHHTNIVPVYATGEANGSHFYAMELVEGPSLDRVIQQMRKGPSSPEPATTCSGDGANAPPDLVQTGPYVESSTASGAAAGVSSSSLGSGSGYFDTVARLIAEVADALEYAHGQGVIHRDIKPSNLLLSAVGRLSVNDFGLARLVEQPGMTMTGEFVGSPLYMSPEQIAAGRAPLDHRTDIYSLGATLYELLTLQPPYGGERRDQVIAQILHKEPRPPRRVNRRVPVDLETICLKAMDKDPDRRYPTARQLAEDLRRYVNRYAISARRAGPITRLAKFVRRHQLGVAAAVVMVLLAATVAVVSWKYRSEQARLAAQQQRAEAEQWMREEVIPTLRRLVREKNYGAAFVLAEKADQAIADDPTLAELRPEFTSFWTVITEPPGADVYVKPYEQPDAEWRPLGRSPLDHVRLPRGFFRWRVTKEGFTPVEGFRDPVEGRIQFALDPEDSHPRGMVRVSGNAYRESLYGLDDLKALDLEDYLIDRYEVTNRQFKEFMDQGGYRERKYWKQPFHDDKTARAVLGASTVGLLESPLRQGPFLALIPGRTEKTVLSWEDGMKRFRDQTGKPGPSQWQSGTYPEGEDDYPVRGVSWYEAAAYAEFAGKSLPTVAHWVRASGHQHKGEIAPLCNFGSSGPAPAGTYQGLGPFWHL